MSRRQFDKHNHASRDDRSVMKQWENIKHTVKYLELSHRYFILMIIITWKELGFL